MLKIKEIEAKTSPKKKQIELKNISVEHLKLVDTDTGEDIRQGVQYLQVDPVGCSH